MHGYGKVTSARCSKQWNRKTEHYPNAKYFFQTQFHYRQPYQHCSVLNSRASPTDRCTRKIEHAKWTGSGLKGARRERHSSQHTEWSPNAQIHFIIHSDLKESDNTIATAQYSLLYPSVSPINWLMDLPDPSHAMRHLCQLRCTFVHSILLHHLMSNFFRGTVGECSSYATNEPTSWTY